MKNFMSIVIVAIIITIIISYFFVSIITDLGFGYDSHTSYVDVIQVDSEYVYVVKRNLNLQCDPIIYHSSSFEAAEMIAEMTNLSYRVLINKEDWILNELFE